jgi:hypothetical protein
MNERLARCGVVAPDNKRPHLCFVRPLAPNDFPGSPVQSDDPFGNLLHVLCLEE